MRNSLNPHDYESRLNASIIRYDGFPVVCNVDQAAQTFTLTGIHPETSFKPIKVKPSDSKLDISTPEIGWMNTKYDGKNTTRFIVRRPVRRWRQGLCETNTTCKYISGSTLRVWPGRGYLLCKGFEDMIMGRYPLLDDALRDLVKNPDTLEVAISREVCLSKQDKVIKVFIHSDEVGWMNPDRRVVKVPHMDNALLISKLLKGFPWEID